MAKFILERGEDFNSNIGDESNKRGLEKVFRQKFKTLGELAVQLSEFRGYIEMRTQIEVPDLPFIVRELPVIYDDPAGYSGQYPIGIVKVLD